MSTETAPPGRAAHLGPERRRPQVLDAALAVAIEGGVGAISIGSVAERLGVTRPVVYACFADRVELIRALVDREERAVLSGALAAFPAAASPEQDFIAGFQALLATVAAHPDSWRFAFDGFPDPAVAEFFGRGRVLVAERFAELIVPTLAKWGTADLERKLPILVELFMSSCEGAVRSLLRPDNTLSANELGEFIGKAVFRAIRDA